MARKVEFIKKSEARILVYIKTAEKPYRNGVDMSVKLEIDYSYIMRLLQKMWAKGWVDSHIYNSTNFFGLTLAAPMQAAKYRLSI